ncbi:MAG: ABC transporter substrate-binding protein [Actinomycetota bacterium]
MVELRRMWVALVTGLALAAGLLGSAASAQEESPSAAPSGGDEPVVFTIGDTREIRNVNPISQVNAIDAWVNYFMYDYLIEFSQEDLSPVPGLAESWTQSEDGLTWTFKLREGLRWSDGEPITAHDYEWFANFVVDENVGEYIDQFPFTDSVTATNDTTIVWKTTRPTLQPGQPGSLILPEHIFGDMTKKEVLEYPNDDNPVVSGPFTITEWDKGQFLRMERNPEYYKGQPHIDELVFRQFGTAETVVQALERGTIDFAEYIPAPLFATLENAPNIETHVGGAATFANLNFNVYEGDKDSTGHPALLDVDVRRAIAHAIDKQKLIDVALGGYGTPGSTVIMPAFAQWHYEPTAEETIPFDLTEANAILDEAGYMDGDGDGVRETPDGQPLELRLLSDGSDSASAKMVPFMKGWLEQIGIDTKTSAVTSSAILDRYYDLDFDMYIYGWSAGPDPDFMLSTFTTDQCLVWSDTCYSNEEYDDLYEQQRRSYDPQERAQLVDDLQRHLYENVPEMVLYYDNDLEAYRSDRWTGFVENPSPDGYLLDQFTMYSAMSVRPIEGDVGTAAEAEGGVSGIVWVAIAAAVIVVIGATIAVRRRREERD